MDQVTMADLEGTIGIGGYKYAMVLTKLSEDYWSFIPLRTMQAGEADLVFRKFCHDVFVDISVVLVYCDNHPSLQRVCDNHNLIRRRPWF